MHYIGGGTSQWLCMHYLFLCLIIFNIFFVKAIWIFLHFDSKHLTGGRGRIVFLYGWYKTQHRDTVAWVINLDVYDKFREVSITEKWCCHPNNSDHNVSAHICKIIGYIIVGKHDRLMCLSFRSHLSFGTSNISWFTLQILSKSKHI